MSPSSNWLTAVTSSADAKRILSPFASTPLAVPLAKSSGSSLIIFNISSSILKKSCFSFTTFPSASFIPLATLSLFLAIVLAILASALCLNVSNILSEAIKLESSDIVAIYASFGSFTSPRIAFWTSLSTFLLEIKVVSNLTLNILSIAPEGPPLSLFIARYLSTYSFACFWVSLEVPAIKDAIWSSSIA